MLSFFPRGVLDEILKLIESVSDGFPSYSFRLNDGKYRGLTGGFLSLRNFSVAISVSPHVCFI